MSVSQRESVASLRLLVCVAKADGVLHDKEREALEASLDGLDLPDVDLASLLAEEWDVEDLADSIADTEAREQVFSSAYALANADGDCSSAERELLGRLRDAWSITPAREEFLSRVIPRTDVDDATAKSDDDDDDDDREESFPVLAGKERDEKIASETRKTAIVNAVLGAFPFPILAIATDLAILGLEIGLAKDIAKFWGKEMDTAQAKGLLASFGVGTAARIAVTNLLKVFPGWGSAAGAASAYASSYAVGTVVNSYFASGEGVSRADLKAQFKKAQAEGKKAYAADKSEVDAKADASKDDIAALTGRLEAGEIDQAEFEKQLAAL